MDPTQTGVSDQDDREDIDADDQQQEILPDSPAARRLAAMDSIGKTRVEQMAREDGVQITPDEPAPDKEPDKQPEPEAKQGQPDQLAQQLADDDLLPPDMLTRKVRLKVDGEEVLVPLEQVVRTAQKESAADRRLREASELLRQAQLAAQGQQSPQTGETMGTMNPSAPQGPSNQDDSTVKARLKDALNAIFSGDEDAATEAFAQVLSQRQQVPAPQIDPDAIVDVVTQKLNERSALDQFFGAYPRIAKNPWLQAAADAELARNLQEGKSFQDALEAAGQSVYQQFGYEREKQTATENKGPTTNRRETLEARKAALDIPAGRTVSAAATGNSPESSEAQRSMTIAEMAAARRPDARAAQRG